MLDSSDAPPERTTRGVKFSSVTCVDLDGRGLGGMVKLREHFSRVGYSVYDALLPLRDDISGGNGGESE
jgi:hypothetical protein